MRFKIVRLTTIPNGSKRTISGSNGFELLQMVLEPNMRWCVSEDTGPIEVDCEISCRLERGTKYSLEGFGNLSLVDMF